ncbi:MULTISPECIES: sialidase family protein [Streptomyces]|uniref:Sialidase family protein n=1 Tax=Streptomyces lonegramiae TaxID=3075524 RepID=A0ABU2X7E4_9ACTN|nr:sialidase family protein [Streptomyces sp. DSM 41529]MDT0541835.1 sialidase family protein [Streptomyces sp. DSM 41529]
MSDPRFDGVVRPSAHDGRVREALLPVCHPGDSHAANLLELDDGDLLCTWFNGPQEGDRDTNVVLSRLPRGADRWTTPAPPSADPGRAEQNPVLAQRPDGTVWLFHPSNEPHDQTTARLIARTSADRGRTWSPPRVLLEGPGVFVRNPPLTLDDGTWLLPAYRCRRSGEHSTVLLSEDGGGSWQEHELPGAEHLVQLTAVPRDDGSLFAMFRSRAADRIHASESTDGGRTWAPPARTALPNNNSAVQLTRLRGGALALVYNHASLERGEYRWVGEGAGRRKKALRTPLTLALSDDGGRTWPHRRDLQTTDEEYWDNEYGYSYPSVVQTRDGLLHIAYSYLRKTIKHLTVAEDWVRDGRP